MKRRDSDMSRPREWWEAPYVIYGFSNQRVRSTLEQLMGSYVVRATDQEYMLDLQDRSRKAHADTVQKRIHGREVKEVEREKRLILEGKMTSDEAPKELANHPVIRATLLCKRILEKMRQKTKKREPKKVKRFNYDLLEGKLEEDVEDLEITSCIDIVEKEMVVLNKVHDPNAYLEYIKEQEEFSDEDYLRIKFEDPLVEEVREMETVDDLYELADEIIGTPPTNKYSAKTSTKYN